MTFATYIQEIRKLHIDAGRRLTLGDPAGEATVRDLERIVGATLPVELLSAWSTADGGEAYSPVFARPGFLTGYDFLPVEGARREREGLKKRAPQYEDYVEPTPRDARIRPGWFAPGWLPFASFGGATLLLMVDLTPTERGSNGQIIAFTHDPDEISWVSTSFAHFLEESLSAFEADAGELLLA